MDALNRRKRKRESINQVLKHPVQKNEGVINLHRYDPTNIGDYYCGPHHYFEALKGKSLDIFDYKSEDTAIRNKWVDTITNNALIIGGGGLLNYHGFSKQMRLFQKLRAKGKKTVLWGVGHNSHRKYTFGRVSKYNIDTSEFGLVGVRDYKMKESWVPCVSCMHPIFDTSFNLKNEIGVIFHKKTLRRKKVIEKFKDLPSMSNQADFEGVVQFIGETDIILTDSYHAMYWAILLGKKVMVFPNSSKFYDFKYTPVISTFSRYKNDLKFLKSYSGVLEECREINRVFSQKVFDYLNL